MKPVTIYEAAITNEYIAIRYYDRNHRDRIKVIYDPPEWMHVFAACLSMDLSAAGLSKEWHVSPHLGYSDIHVETEPPYMGWEIKSVPRSLLQFEKPEPKLKVVK